LYKIKVAPLEPFKTKINRDDWKILMIIIAPAIYNDRTPGYKRWRSTNYFGKVRFTD
jgi:hypothetical protein